MKLINKKDLYLRKSLQVLCLQNFSMAKEKSKIKSK